LLQVQGAENQIVTHHEVFAERPEDSQLLTPATVWVSTANGRCRHGVLQSEK
jgi:hypothetical protein